MKPIDIVLVAAGGYAAGYVRELLDEAERMNARLAGIVEPYPDSCPHIAEVYEKGIAVYADMESFYAERAADLAVISSPIQFHAEQAVCAMEHGSHVLLEKPIAADVAGAKRIEAACARTGKLLAIGYQWCYNRAMLALKRDILAGEFGAPVSMRAVVLWPRKRAYYQRGIGWAGRRYDAQNRAVMDSVVSNATAHYLMNMLWLLGPALDRAAELNDLRAVTSRAYPIENFDTVHLTGEVNGAKLLYIASHAVDRAHGPEFEYVFERGTLHSLPAWDGEEELVVKLFDGGERRYPGMSQMAEIGPKLWRTVDAVRGDEGAIYCPPAAAIEHTKVMDRLNALPILDLSAECVVDEKEDMIYMPGLFDRLMGAYREFAEPGQ